MRLSSSRASSTRGAAGDDDGDLSFRLDVVGVVGVVGVASASTSPRVRANLPSSFSAASATVRATALSTAAEAVAPPCHPAVATRGGETCR